MTNRKDRQSSLEFLITELQNRKDIVASTVEVMRNTNPQGVGSALLGMAGLAVRMLALRPVVKPDALPRSASPRPLPMFGRRSIDPTRIDA